MVSCITLTYYVRGNPKTGLCHLKTKGILTHMGEMEYGPPLPKELMFKRLADEGITVEEAADQKYYPKELNRAGFEDLSYSDWDDVEELSGSCRNFLAGPIISDSFETHGERRDWRLEAHEKYGKVFSDLNYQNKLRLNVLGNVYSGLLSVIKTLDRKNIKTPQAETVRELSKQLPDLSKYRDIPTEQKREIVKNMEKVAHQFLDMLSRQSK